MIRLARIGKKKQPYYRLIISEKARDLYGRHLEILGNYNPRTKKGEFKKERILYWLNLGAKASATVHNLLITNKVIEGKKEKVSTISKKKLEKMKKKVKSETKESEKKEVKVAPVTEEKNTEGVKEVAGAEVKNGKELSENTEKEEESS